MEDNYTKAYQEVLEILKYVPEESVDKIPKEMIEMFEKEKSKTHNFKVDITKTFEEQGILEETKAIFANIYRDYWATPQEREEIIQKERKEREILEQAKREKYNPDELFKKKNESIIREVDNTKENTQIIEYKKDSFFKKIADFLKKIFHII